MAFAISQRFEGEVVDENALNVLNTPVHLPFSGKVSQNRLMKAAMSELLSSYDQEDPFKRGRPSPLYASAYTEWGKGGYGIILSGNIVVHREYLEDKGNAVIDYEIKEDYTEDFRNAISQAKKHGSLFIGQLTHAGRQTSSGITSVPVGPSDIKCPDGSAGKKFGKPRPLTEAEIKDVAYRFGYAAKVLRDAGADGVQLHGAHGYLISQFLSPRVNTRTDAYGGSLENRSRLIFEIIAEIRKQVENSQNFAIGIKLNSQDHIEGGFSEEESAQLVRKLEEAKVDFVEDFDYKLISGGTFEKYPFVHKEAPQRESTVQREAYFLQFSAQVRPQIKHSLLAVTGGFRSAGGMVGAIQQGACDIVGLGRPITIEPNFGKNLLEGRVKGAIISHIPAVFTIPASNRQIFEMAAGKPITTFTTKEEVEGFIAALTSKFLSGNDDPEFQVGLQKYIFSASQS